MATRRSVPIILLVAALAGIVTFSQGFRLIDTIALFVCGLMAGASIAALARRRGKP